MLRQSRNLKVKLPPGTTFGILSGVAVPLERTYAVRPVATLLCTLQIILIAGTTPTPGSAERYRMPWEEELERQPIIRPDTLHAIKVVRDKMEIVRLPLGGKAVISSDPEIADLYLRDPDMLFVIGRLRGETSVVVAGDGLEPIWSGTVTVTDFAEEEDEE